MRHEAHIFIVASRRVPFSKKEERRMYALLERFIKQHFKAQALKIEVVIP